MLRRRSSNRFAVRAASWLLLVVALGLGCSTRTTSLDDFDLFFRFRADGTLVEYTSREDVFGVYTLVTGSPAILNIVGFDATTRLRLRLSSLEEIPGPGTYTIAQTASDSTFTMELYYQSPDGTDYFAAPVVPEDATIVISSVGGLTIDGTFFGIVKAPGVPDVVITEGEFAVRRDFDIRG